MCQIIPIKQHAVRCIYGLSFAVVVAPIYLWSKQEVAGDENSSGQKINGQKKEVGSVVVVGNFNAWILRKLTDTKKEVASVVVGNSNAWIS